VPKLNTFADVVTDLERLLAAANANTEILPGVEVLKAPIEAAIAEMRSLATRRDTLNADKQVLSADLKVAMQHGRDLGSQFRGFARAHVGMRSEKMVEFRTPVRRLGTQTRRSKGGLLPTPLPSPTPPETGAPAPAGGENGQA
jgi:hypothetical protein